MFLAVDGDDIGTTVERLIVRANPQEVSEFSQRIREAIETIEERLARYDATIVMRGGDSILARLQDVPKSTVEQIIRFEVKDFTFSAGIGQTMPEAFLALKLAKAEGKHRCVDWTSFSGYSSARQ